MELVDWITLRFGFSWTGGVFLILLFVPNLLWTKNLPQGYSPAGENRLLLIFERTGEVLVTCLLLITVGEKVRTWNAWCWWLVPAAISMAAYEGFWLRYFRGEHTLEDFYGSFWGVPVAGATLPVLAALCLGVYRKSLWLILAAVILGIGHIGIHFQHRKALDPEKNGENNA